jgi:hypothetical protein
LNGGFTPIDKTTQHYYLAIVTFTAKHQVNDKWHAKEDWRRTSNWIKPQTQSLSPYKMIHGNWRSRRWLAQSTLRKQQRQRAERQSSSQEARWVMLNDIIMLVISCHNEDDEMERCCIYSSVEWRHCLVFFGCVVVLYCLNGSDQLLVEQPSKMAWQSA